MSHLQSGQPYYLWLQLLCWLINQNSISLHPLPIPSDFQLWLQTIRLEVLLRSTWAVSWAADCIASDICLSALMYKQSVKRMNATAFSLIGYSGYLYSEIWQFLMLPSRGLYSLLNLTIFINIINIMRLLNNIILLSLS